jgi:two-component system response regulator RegA
MQHSESNTRDLRVLLVDDDRLHRQQLEQGLIALGHTVRSANSFDDMLTSVRGFTPDWAVVEPVSTGTSWVRYLRAASKSLRQSPWLVLTAFASKAMRSESMQLGARHFLDKPASAKQIVDILSGSNASQDHGAACDLSLARVEWEHLNDVLRLCEGNITEAARCLGIQRQSLYNKLRKLPTVRLSSDPLASKYLTRRT